MRIECRSLECRSFKCRLFKCRLLECCLLKCRLPVNNFINDFFHLIFLAISWVCLSDFNVKRKKKDLVHDEIRIRDFSFFWSSIHFKQTKRYCFVFVIKSQRIYLNEIHVESFIQIIQLSDWNNDALIIFHDT